MDAATLRLAAAALAGLAALHPLDAAAQTEPPEQVRAGAIVDSLVARHPAPSHDDSLRIAAALDSLGVRLAGGGTEAALVAAESLVLRALAIQRRTLGRGALAVAATLDHVAALRFNRSDYEGALAPRQECLEIRTRHLAHDDALLARTRHELGANLAALARYPEARPLLEAARTTLEQATPRDDLSLVNLLTTLGELRRIENRYADAESCLVQATRLARGALPPDDPFVSYPLNNLAGVYKDQGRFDEAAPLLRESLAIRARAAAPDAAALAEANLNLAELTRLQGRTTEAETLYIRAIDFARRGLGADSPSMVWFLNQYGVLHRDLRRWRRAEQLSRQSLAILEQAGGDESLRAQTLVDLAELLRLQGRRREAEPHARRAIALREQLFGVDHPEVATALLVLARCRTTRTDVIADSLTARAVRILDAAPAHLEGRIDAHVARADLHAARGDRQAAIDDMAVALAAVEALRPRRGGEDVRAGFVGEHARLYEKMTRWCLAAGDTARAFETVERSRARVFLDQLAAARVDLAGRVPDAVRAPLDARLQEARLQLGSSQDQLAMLVARTDLAGNERTRRIERLGAERDRWAVELERAQEELRRASPEWRSITTEAGRPVTLDVVAREVTPGGGLVLVYAMGEDGGWVFAVPEAPGPARCWSLALDAASAADLGLASGPLRARDLARAIATLDLATSPRTVVHRGIGRVRPADPGAPDAGRARRLHALWTALVPAALRPSLLASPEVIVVPDGALHTLPVEALVVQLPKTGAARDWLAVGPVVRYAASATSAYALQRAAPRRTASAGGVLSVAAPGFDAGNRASALAGRRLPPLPSTAQEADAVRTAFAPLPVATLTGADATEARVRAALPAQRFVHLATHGVVDRGRDALLAGLALAPGALPARHEDDGFLQLFEIYGLRLDCDLAVLSACETSAGTFVEGEGVFALSRGFLAAGVRRVVASLWQVEDASTAALVGAFFRRLAASERDGQPLAPAVALRDAKREVRAHAAWRQPFYWAPFVLAGAR
jgi:tetratricopeptide (TPR) repeat protein